MLYLTPSGHAVRLDDDVELPGRLSIGSHGYAQLNGDRLDCRRSNLRVVTPAESSANVRGRAASGYRGVYSTSGGRYYAAAKQGGRIIRLGVFDDPVEAAEVADAWRQEHLPGYVRR
jgi:hypothetical protein